LVISYAVEIAAALSADIPVLFVCVAVSREGDQASLRRGRGAVKMLLNFSNMVDVKKAECTVQADKERELALVDATEVNAQVRAALSAAMAAVQADVPELYAYQCGEPEALAAVAPERRLTVLEAASAAGLVAVVAELADQVYLKGDNEGADYPFYPLFIAASNGHLTVVRTLLVAGAQVDMTNSKGVFALFIAAQEGYVTVVCALLEAGAEVDKASNNSYTSLIISSFNGFLNVVRALVAAGADANRSTEAGWSPLFVAAKRGHLATVAFLLESGADPLKASSAEYSDIPAGTTPAEVAEAGGHVEVAALLRK
jgi:hypothetical protein